MRRVAVSASQSRATILPRPGARENLLYSEVVGVRVSTNLLPRPIDGRAIKGPSSTEPGQERRSLHDHAESLFAACRTRNALHSVRFFSHRAGLPAARRGGVLRLRFSPSGSTLHGSGVHRLPSHA